jgi:hypothetical protein
MAGTVSQRRSRISIRCCGFGPSIIAALLAKQHAFLVSQENPTTAVQPRGVRPESKSTFSRLPFSYFAG